MSANFPERQKSSAKDLRELWRRMKTKAKAMVRAKKINLHKTGGGAADVGELGPEIIAIVAIIAADLEQIHNDVDDDAMPMFEGLAQTQTYIDNVTASTSTADSQERANQEYSENISSAEEHEELEDGGALHITQNTQTSKPILISSGKKKTFSTATRHESRPVLQKTTEVLSYLKEEHEAKMALIELQKNMQTKSLRSKI